MCFIPTYMQVPGQYWVAEVIYNKAIFNGVITLIQSPSCNRPSVKMTLTVLFSLVDTEWITSV